jgi:hypothetical protein
LQRWFLSIQVVSVIDLSHSAKGSYVKPHYAPTPRKVRAAL